MASRTLLCPFSVAHRMPCFNLLLLTKGPALLVPNKATQLVRFLTCSLMLFFMQAISGNQPPCLPLHSSLPILPLHLQFSIHILIWRGLILYAQICPLLPRLGPHGLPHPLGLHLRPHLQLEQHSASLLHLLCHIHALLPLQLITLIQESRHHTSLPPLLHIPHLSLFLSIIILRCSVDICPTVRITTPLPPPLLPQMFLSWSCLHLNTLNSPCVPQFLCRVLPFGHTSHSYRDWSRTNLSSLRQQASCWLVLVAGL